MKATTRPQFAGALRLPNGWDRISAVKGTLEAGRAREMRDAPREFLRRGMVLDGFDKSTDRILRSLAPACKSKRAIATKESMSSG